MVNISGYILEEILVCYREARRDSEIAPVKFNLSHSNVIVKAIIGYDFYQMDAVLKLSFWNSHVF